jgi:hypothetical protein
MSITPIQYGTTEKATYTLYINSSDKISGTNNNATFNINWNDFLPRQYDLYKMVYSFQSTGGYYKDNGTTAIYSTAEIIFNTQGKTFSYDTTTMATSNTIGYIQRDIQTANSSSNTLTAFYMMHPPKTIMRPNQNLINISIVNTYTNSLLCNTDNGAPSAPQADMTPWNMVIEFIPIASSIQTK